MKVLDFFLHIIVNIFLNLFHYRYEGDNVKKIIMLLICLFIGIMVYQKNEEILIPNDSIRIRIIANSNNIGDIVAKVKLKEAIKNDIYDLVKDAKSREEAYELITNNMEKIESIVSEKNSNYDISLGKNYFPKKSYKGVIYQEGIYDSLVITLGEGLGENWWCVLYPPLCLIEDNDTTLNIEYKLALKKLLSN